MNFILFNNKYKLFNFSINAGSSTDFTCCGCTVSKTAKDQTISNHSIQDV